MDRYVLNWVIGIDMYTLMCTKLMTNKNLLYKKKKKREFWDFPGGAVVKNPPVNAGNVGLIPGPGRSHMSWSN